MYHIAVLLAPAWKYCVVKQYRHLGITYNSHHMVTSMIECTKSTSINFVPLISNFFFIFGAKRAAKAMSVIFSGHGQVHGSKI